MFYGYKLAEKSVCGRQQSADTAVNCTGFCAAGRAGRNVFERPRCRCEFDNYSGTKGSIL